MMKCIFSIKINIKVFYKLILSFWVCAARHTQSTQNKFAYLSNNFRKAWEMKLIFCLQINTSFLQVDSITWVCLVRHAQTTQNNKFTISLQYHKENVKDEVDFLPADKPQRFLQSDSVILGVWLDMHKLTKITSLLFLCNIVRNK